MMTQLTVTPEMWSQLAVELPEPFKHLCYLCERFEDTFVFLVQQAPVIPNSDFLMLQDYIRRILDAYLRIIRTYGVQDSVAKEQLDMLRKEMALALSPWFSEKNTPLKGAEWNEIIRIWTIVKNSGMVKLSEIIASYVAPAANFIHSNIYDTLEAAKTKSESQFGRLFVEECFARSGGIPLPKEDTGRWQRAKDD